MADFKCFDDDRAIAKCCRDLPHIKNIAACVNGALKQNLSENLDCLGHGARAGKVKKMQSARAVGHKHQHGAVVHIKPCSADPRWPQTANKRLFSMKNIESRRSVSLSECFRGGFFYFAKRARARHPPVSRKATQNGLKTTHDAQKRREEADFPVSERTLVSLLRLD